MSRTGKSAETESRLRFPKTGAGGGAGAEGFFLGEWILTVVMAALLCEYTKNNPTLHFKWVSGVVCKLYSNKAVTKKK